MRTLRSIVVWVAVAAIVSACSGPPGSSAAGSQQAGNEPSVPAGQSEGAAASQPAGSAGGSAGAAPSLADGPWTGGHGQTTTSGAVSWTTDAPITTSVSSTGEHKTLLAYNTDDTFVTIFINLIGIPFSASVTAPDWDATSHHGCEVTYNRADDTGIDATFSCVVDEFIYMGIGEEPTGEVRIEGSFTATR